MHGDAGKVDAGPSELKIKKKALLPGVRVQRLAWTSEPIICRLGKV